MFATPQTLTTGKLTLLFYVKLHDHIRFIRVLSRQTKDQDIHFVFKIFILIKTRPTVLHCQAPLSIQGCRY